MTNKLDREESVEADGPTTTCGIGSWRPQYLQFMANPKFFMLNFSLIAIIQGSFFSYFIGCTSTLEKRFAYSGRLSGLLLIAGTLASIMLSPVIGFFGKNTNRAKMMGWGMMLVSFACFMKSFPYFIYGPMVKPMIQIHSSSSDVYGSHLFNSSMEDVHSTDFCTGKSGDECPTDGSSLTIWPAYIILWSSSFISGVGNACFYTLGFPYMDDNVSKKDSPLYFSILSAVRLLGPTSGFLMVSVFLNLNEDIFSPMTISKKDPRFVGAWWLGYVVIGIALWLVSLPLFLFPAELKPNRKKSIVELEETKLPKIKEAKAIFKRLLTNPVFMFDSAAGVFRFIGIAGYYITQPKYIESQFRKTAASASLFTGTFSIISMAFGNLSGGLFIKFAKPGPRLLTSLIFTVELFASAGIMSGLFFGCPQSSFVGFDPNQFGAGTHSFGSGFGETGSFNPIQQCNTNCSCSQRVLQPVCGSDGKSNYFSPCFAGCTSYDNGTYHDCSCDEEKFATKGYCPVECDNFYKYIVLLSLGKLISFTARTGNYLVRFRSIEDRDKSFALGVMATVHGLFGSLPMPILFGYIADSACLIWEKSCGGTGNCWLYDTEKFRYVLHGSSVLFMIVGSTLDIFTIIFSSRMKNMYGEDDDKEKGDTDGEDTGTDTGGDTGGDDQLRSKGNGMDMKMTPVQTGKESTEGDAKL